MGTPRRLQNTFMYSLGNRRHYQINHRREPMPCQIRKLKLTYPHHQEKCQSTAHKLSRA